MRPLFIQPLALAFDFRAEKPQGRKEEPLQGPSMARI